MKVKATKKELDDHLGVLRELIQDEKERAIESEGHLTRNAYENEIVLIRLEGMSG